MPFVFPESEDNKSTNTSLVCEKCLGDELIGGYDMHGNPRAFLCLCTKSPSTLTRERIESFNSSGIKFHPADERLTDATWGTMQGFLEQFKNGILDKSSTPEGQIKKIKECKSCVNLGYKINEGRSGNVVAERCKTCHAKREDLINAITQGNIPNRYLSAVVDTGEKSPEKSFLFFYGGVGTGKTHRAIQILSQAIKSESAQSALYVPLYDILEAKRRSLAVGFDDKDEKREAEHTLKKYRKALLDTDFVIIDELGQERMTEQEDKTLFGIIDKRYAKNKPTILISNHGLEKDKSLNRKTIENFVGARTLSRIKDACHIYFDGPDKRDQKPAVEAEVVTKEEAENFNMGEASKKLMVLDDKTQHIMTWLTRNPAFETVSHQRRKLLTAIKPNGDLYDKDRPTADFYNDVWINGDSLRVTGPVCDQDDMRLYGLLMTRLTENHREGSRGLFLEISLREILDISGLSASGDSFAKLQRQLDRLTRMSMDFQNAKGHRWRGPLINDVITIGEGRNCKAKIGFNHFMITFYTLQEYTLFKKDVARDLKGDSFSFYLFYASQTLPEMKISVEKCKKLLGIKPTFDKKEASKKIKKSVQDLIDAGIMDAHKTYIKGGIVYTYRKSA